VQTAEDFKVIGGTLVVVPSATSDVDTIIIGKLDVEVGAAIDLGWGGGVADIYFNRLSVYGNLEFDGVLRMSIRGTKVVGRNNDWIYVVGNLTLGGGAGNPDMQLSTFGAVGQNNEYTFINVDDGTTNGTWQGDVPTGYTISEVNEDMILKKN
jgi:hypothetical protein